MINNIYILTKGSNNDRFFSIFFCSGMLQTANRFIVKTFNFGHFEFNQSYLKTIFLYTLKKSGKAVIFETLSQKYKNICYYGFDFWKKRKTSKCLIFFKDFVSDCAFYKH